MSLLALAAVRSTNMKIPQPAEIQLYALTVGMLFILKAMSRARSLIAAIVKKRIP